MAATWKVVACDRTVALGGEADVITTVHWEVTDEETGRVFTLPALPRRTELAFGLLDEEPPIFDETLFDTEVNRQWGEERPEFAAYLKHQLKTTDFEDRYLKQANPEPMDDRLANLELQQDKLDLLLQLITQ